MTLTITTRSPCHAHYGGGCDIKGRGIAALIVGASALVSCGHGQSRAAECHTYKNALIVAYSDPTSNDPVVGLADVDRIDVEDSRVSYQQSGDRLANWDAYVKRQIPIALARQNC